MYVSVSQTLSRAIDRRASWFMCVSTSQALSRATGGPQIPIVGVAPAFNQITFLLIYLFPTPVFTPKVNLS